MNVQEVRYEIESGGLDYLVYFRKCEIIPGTSLTGWKVTIQEGGVDLELSFVFQRPVHPNTRLAFMLLEQAIAQENEGLAEEMGVSEIKPWTTKAVSLEGKTWNPEAPLQCPEDPIQ